MYLRLADVMEVGEANEAAKQKKKVSKIIDLMSVQRPRSSARHDKSYLRTWGQK